MKAKPRDPDYFKKYRAAHPEYRKRELQRVKSRKSKARGNRSAEYRHRNDQRVKVDTTPLPVLHRGHPLFEQAVLLVQSFLKPDRRNVMYDPIFDDLVGVAVVALLERKDPAERTRQYMNAELAWRTWTLPLLDR